MKNIKIISVTLIVLLSFGLMTATTGLTQTRESGPWWPSIHGPDDQAGASNWITAEKLFPHCRYLKQERLSSSGTAMKPVCRLLGTGLTI